MTERDIQNTLYRWLEPHRRWVMPNFTPMGWWECDIAAVSTAGYFSEYEIKVTLSDLRADGNKERLDYARHHRPKFGRRINKHVELANGSLLGPSYFWYVLSSDVPPLAALKVAPPWSGIVTVGDAFCVVRKATRLHRHRAKQRLVREMQRIAYYRYCNLRFDKMGNDQGALDAAERETA